MTGNYSPSAKAGQKHNPVFDQRRVGVLLHPTSLPGGEELGELGPDAFRFVDFLVAANVTVWQVLPLGPTHTDLSPYMSPSLHAGNTRMISLELLHQEGWLNGDEIVGDDPQHRRRELLYAAHRGFNQKADEKDQRAYREFCQEHQSWLDDYALYQALRQLHHGQAWTEWPEVYRDRKPAALTEIQKIHGDIIEQVHFEQFLFFKQWVAIKRYANEQGIYLFGDMPIFVAHDSAEVWAQPSYFDLDQTGQPGTVAGVPPDYFSTTGQHWGNPHYRWDVMAEDGYQWWLQRMHTARELFDVIRLDHFRGFEAYWEIPADAQLPSEGHWVKGPGGDLFDALFAAFPGLALVAEDLGVITPQVEELRDRYQLPGMKILQFAFDGNPSNPYLPQQHVKNSVVYTGTHDNDTSVGWYASLDEQTRDYVSQCLSENGETDMPWSLIEAALASPALLAVIPMQDLLALGSEARMNTPGVSGNNWHWRFNWEQLPDNFADTLSDLIQRYDREGR